MTRCTTIACALAAALSAAAEPGGVTFDFEAISAKRFAGAFDPQRNVLKERFEGVATNTVRLTLPLPSTNGGVWRVSARYKLRHTAPGGKQVRFRVEPSDDRPFKIHECGYGWGELSTVVDVGPGRRSLSVAFVVADGDCAVLEYKDVSLVDETPRSPIVLKEMPMGNLDGRFAVSEGGYGRLEYYWRRTVPERLSARNITFEVELPPGIDFVDSSYAANGIAKTERRADGSSLTTFVARKEPRDKLETGGPPSIVVKATGKPGPCGSIRLAVRYADRKNPAKDFTVAADPIELFIVPAKKARVPRRYCNGIMPGGLFSNIGNEALEGISRTIADAGITWLVANAPQETYSLWRSLGIWRITPSANQFNNGFQIGRRVPESDRFVTVGASSKHRRAYALTHATCPVTVYEGSDFFRTNTIPYIKDFVKGGDGCWSNWEPWAFQNKGCMCMRCCRAFAKYIGKPYDEIAAKWPKCVMKGGEYFAESDKFRSIEHAKVVTTVDRIVREATGGDSSLGLIPGICWIEMSSWWRPIDYPPEVKPIYYAGSLRWMNPWGPYATWESDTPYVYSKRKPLCHFTAAQDVRRTVDADYPEGARPKLMALPQGYMCGHWLTQPEHISMALDSYFFNGWEATVVYYFPRGYDARYWNAFAEATDRAARFEDFVLDGRRTDSETSVAPFPGVYAVPVRASTGYLRDSLDVPMLQCVSYDLGGRRIAAVFNFWQKGEAFFTLRAKGLKPGRYEVVMEDGSLRVHDGSRTSYTAEELAEGVALSVGASRTRVFEIRPCGTVKAAASAETDASFGARFDAARSKLERAAAEDAEYEKANGYPAPQGTGAI